MRRRTVHVLAVLDWSEVTPLLVAAFTTTATGGKDEGTYRRTLHS